MNQRLLVFYQGLKKSPFAWTLLLLIVFQGLFLIIASMEWLPKHWLFKGNEHLQTAVFLFLVYSLVSINTLIFIFDASPIVAPLFKIKGIDENCKQVLKKRYIYSIGALCLSVFISGGLATVVAISIFSAEAFFDSWGSFLKLNESLCVILFGAFVIADYLCLDACKIALRCCPVLDTETRDSLDQFIKTVKLYIYACDGPGLFGIVVILVISSMLYPIVAGFYWHGFVAGAIGLHIAFSQTALALLSVMEV